LLTLTLGRAQLGLLALLSALASLATHAFMPAMPAAAHDLNVGAQAIQLAVSLFLVVFAAGQLMAGGLSDRVGRRPVLIGGALLFAFGSALAAWAESLSLLLAGRAAQAAGGSAALVVSRSVVADRSGERAAGQLALLMLIALASPAFAPVLGGLVTETAGWRTVFVLLFSLGLASAAGVMLLLDEYRGISVGPKASYAALLGDWRFLRFGLTGACGSSGIYAFLSGSAFVFREHHLSATESGLAYAAVALSVAGGALSLARGWWRGRALAIGATVYLTGSCAMLAGAWFAPGIATLIASMMVTGFGSGLVAPSALSGALTARAGAAGAASSLFGTLQISGGALASFTLGLCAHPSQMVIALILCLAGLAISILLRMEAMAACAEAVS
jgi:DHA1 family bicyclomycin/chloramphenicol resistance-like MFS transporter